MANKISKSNKTETKVLQVQDAKLATDNVEKSREYLPLDFSMDSHSLYSF